MFSQWNLKVNESLRVKMILCALEGLISENKVRVLSKLAKLTYYFENADLYFCSNFKMTLKKIEKIIYNGKKLT